MPHAMVDDEAIIYAVQLACRAPSLHNSQPWRWVADGSFVHLFADRGRVGRAADSSREALIGCGVALDHFRIAMAAAGWNTTVDQFPDPANPRHLARIDITPLDFVRQACRDRADAIMRRRTDRLPFRSPADWESVEYALRNCFDNDLVALDVLAHELRPQLAEVSRLTARLRRGDDCYHHELGWWTAHFSSHHGHGVRCPGICHDEAKILVLSTPDDTRDDALNCGQVLSTVLLECTLAGLATCPLTHLTEIGAGRDVLRAMIGRRSPQVLVRVGSTPAIDEIPPATPRRPVSDLLKIRQ